MNSIDIANYAQQGLELVGMASVLAGFTKTKWDNKILSWVATALHLLAFNLPQAKAAAKQTTLKVND